MKPHSGLPRSLRRLDLTAIGLNATVGSGIFLLPDDLFRTLGPWSPAAFGLCVLGLLPIAWCFAEAARRTRSTGGPYEYARQEFGNRVGFTVGWMCFCNAVVSFAAVAAAAAAYAGRLVPVLDGQVGRCTVAALSIGVFSALNVIGAKPGAWAIRLFTLGKFAVLLLLVGALIPQMGQSDVFDAGAGGAAAPTWQALRSATFIALFALQGFEVVGVPAGETADPERQIPWAVLSTLFVSGLLYVIVQTVLVTSVDQLGQVSDAPLADAALAVAPAFATVVAGGALISTLGFVSGSALGTPRYVFAMANHGHLLGLLARLHPQFRTPHIAIIGTGAIATLLVLPFDYRTLIGFSNVAVAVQYGATSLAVLRRAALDGRRAAAGLATLASLASLSIWWAASGTELLTAWGVWALGWLLDVSFRRPAPRDHSES